MKNNIEKNLGIAQDHKAELDRVNPENKDVYYHKWPGMRMQISEFSVVVTFQAPSQTLSLPNYGCSIPFSEGETKNGENIFLLKLKEAVTFLQNLSSQLRDHLEIKKNRSNFNQNQIKEAA